MNNTIHSKRYVRWLYGLLFLLTGHITYADDSLMKMEFDLVGLYNPLGISFSSSAYYRQSYHYSEGDSPLWQDLYWQGGAQLAANPAYQRGGFHVEWVPIAILLLRAQYDRYYFTGSNGSLLAFDDTTGHYGDDEIAAREGEEQSGYGKRYLLGLTLRAKLGSVIVRNVTNLARYEFPGAGPYYLEREYELLMTPTDHLFSNQFYLLYESKDGKGTSSYFGPYYDYVQIRETRLERERLGVTFFQESGKSLGFLQRPRWYIQSGVYLTERNRQDELFLVFGIGGEYDF